MTLENSQPDPSGRPEGVPAARSLFEKIWDAHKIATRADGASVLYVDRHVVHEVSSARAFRNLDEAGARVRNPELTFATMDHIVSTAQGRTRESFPGGKELLDYLEQACRKHGITLFGLDDPRQGIVHMMAVEQGLVLPGSIVVCGDSHTSTAGALGAFALGVGTSDVEHALRTQTVARPRPRTMRITFTGTPEQGVTSKDVMLHLIGTYGTAGGAKHAVEYAGPTIEAMSVEQRLALCNMSVEFGARAGMIAPDDKVADYLAGRPFAPKGEMWDRALAEWRDLRSDDEAVFDTELHLDCDGLTPRVTWGTSPQDTAGVADRVPDPGQFADEARRKAAVRSLDYMGLIPGTPISDIAVDVAFIGSCTNGRLSDLEEAAAVVRGRRVAEGVRAIVVPGSREVRNAAEAKGLHRIFVEAGLEWREPGCSMCLSINDDQVPAGQRCISSSNRNFEGRQGPGSRTHLASPATVAASAVTGRITDHRGVR